MSKSYRKGDTRCVAIEGGSGAGKTTTARALSSALRGPPPILEYFFYLDRLPGQKLPLFPPGGQSELRSENRIWPQIDLMRSKEISQISQNSQDWHVVDTTVVSVLAYEFAKQRLGYLSDLRYLSKQFIPLYVHRVCVEPCLWIFLTPSISVLMKRVEEKGGTRHLLENEIAAVHTNQFRALFCSQYCLNGNVLSLDNSLTSLECNVRSMLDFINGRTAINIDRSPILNLLRDVCSGHFERSLIHSDPAF